MKVLVTGGTGHVGCHTVKALCDGGHQVRMFVRSPDRVGPALDPLGVSVDDVVVGDVTDEDATAMAVAGCDAVIHAANIFSFEPKLADAMWRVNTVGTGNVLRLASEAGLDPIVHVSTLGTLLGDAVEVTDESDIGRPFGPYTASKIEAERIARRFQSDGVPVVVAWPAGVSGPCDPHLGEFARFVISVLKGQVRLVIDGFFPLSDVRDVAAGLSATLEPGQGPRRFLLGGNNVRIREAINIIGEATGRNLSAVKIPYGMAITVARMGDFINRRFGAHPPFLSEAVSYIKVARPLRPRRAIEELGITFRPADESITDTLVWMLAEGHITRRQAGRLVHGPATGPKATG